jgi:DNA transposition AAA+ family ATPase
MTLDEKKQDSNTLIPAGSNELAEVNQGDTTRASWPISAADLRSNIAHCSETGRDAIVRAFMWCIDPAHPVRKSEFAREVDYDENTIYKILTGRYKGPDGKLLDIPEKLIKGIANFMEREKDRFLGKKQEFIESPTAKRIFTTCDLVRESRSMGMIWGPSHCGKSWALEHYQQTNNHGRTIYARLGAADGLGGMLKLMSVAAGNSDKANGADIKSRLKRALAPGMLFILDEVHELAYTYQTSSFFKCIEVIREIHDKTKCGFLLCGTQLMLDDMNAARAGELQQVWRRGVHKLDLTNSPTKADVAAIVQHAGLEMPGAKLTVRVAGTGGNEITEHPLAILRQLAKDDGLLSITERLRYGRKLAQKEKPARRLSWHSFTLAHLMIKAQQTPQESGWDKEEA